jgi:L-iditol 2-dehydrogenase
MKACVLHAVGDLRFEDVQTPTPGNDEVLLKVGACGVCGSDIPRVFSKGTYHFPTIPGHELAGEIVQVGKYGDPSIQGKLAAVFPLIPCRHCAACEIGEYAQCSHYNYLGSRCDGGFAEYVRVPIWNLVLVPDGVSLEEAAMTEPAAVAIHALRQAGVDIGDTVVIFGAGSIGLMLALWSQAWGASRVLLIDIDDAKLDFAAKLGFRHGINAKRTDPVAWVQEMTELGGDLIVEASGSSVAFDQCMRVARPFGRVVLMGNPEGEMHLSSDGYSSILRKELVLHGTWNSTYSELPHNEWHLALDFMASGKLNLKSLITQRVALDRLPDTLAKVRDRAEFTNKVMFVNEQS